MSIKNNQNKSDVSVVIIDNPLQNGHMDKPRRQIIINFQAALKAKFDAECERRRAKPAQLASAIIEWWLREPRFVQSLAWNGYESIPAEAVQPAIEALVKHFEEEAHKSRLIEAEIQAGRELAEVVADAPPVQSASRKPRTRR